MTKNYTLELDYQLKGNSVKPLPVDLMFLRRKKSVNGAPHIHAVGPESEKSPVKQLRLL